MCISSCSFSPTLGRGEFGVVYKAFSKDASQKPLALKSISKQKLGKELEVLHSQYDALRRLDHPNIVKFYEAYEDKNYFYNVMELLTGGELLGNTDAPVSLSELEVAHIMKQAFSAVAYLHSKGIVHRDIKTENFLYRSQTPGAPVVLIDFGFSKMAAKYQVLTTRIGTPFYVSPEVIDGKYDHRCDDWSLGVMMHKLLVGEYPFYDDTTAMVLKKISLLKLRFKGDKWTKISPNAKNLLEKLLEKDPSKRISSAEALKHPWFRMTEN